jgi:hypothetical protein
MRAYKFLRAGRRAPFSDLVWPENSWVSAQRPLDACGSGIHACRPEHLAYWLMPELWEIELDGDVLETELKVVAERGRLLRRIDAWDESVRLDLGEECVRRTARYAVLELRELGLAREVELLEAAPTVSELAKAAVDVADTVDDGHAADLAAYVGDAHEYAQLGHVSGAAFIAAHAADLHSPVGVDDPFAAERVEQSRWLAERLALSGS